MGTPKSRGNFLFKRDPHLVEMLICILLQHNESNEDIDYTPERRLVLRCPVMAQVKHLLRYRRIIIVSNQGGIETFLEHGKCLHTTLLADNNDTSIPEKMFRSCHEWALRQQAAFRGMVYIFVRLVMLNERVDRHFYEVWIPLK